MRYRAGLLTCVLVLACSPDTPTTPQDPQAAPEMDAGNPDLPPHLRNLPGMRFLFGSRKSRASLSTGMKATQRLAAFTLTFPPPTELSLSGNGSDQIVATDVTADGQVSGYYTDAVGRGFGVRWAPNGSAEVVSTNLFFASSAVTINANGQMGLHTNGPGGYRYDGPGSLIPLPAPPPFDEIPFSYALPHGISDDGRLVGNGRWDGAEDTRDFALLWAANGSVSVLAAPTMSAVAWDINEAGQVVGEGCCSGPTREALVWAPDGSPTILPKLDPEASALAFGQSNSGTIVGLAEESASGVLTPLKWQNGAVSALAKPPGSNAHAVDVNEAGLIVGAVCPNTLGDDCHGVVWGPDGTLLGELPGIDCDAVPEGITCGTGAEAIEGNYVVGNGFILQPGSPVFIALRWTLPADPGATGTGTNVAVAPVDPATNTSPVTLTFGSVTTEGTTTVTSSTQGVPLPLGFQLGDPPVYYDLATTAQFSGSITVCFTYDPAAYQIRGT
jgi:hypothetical protein